MKPSERIAALAALHTNLDVKSRMTAGILDYLDELEAADVGDPAAMMPIGAAALLALLKEREDLRRDLAQATACASELSRQERRITLKVPRGMVAVETDGRVELWFTNEVIPKRHSAVEFVFSSARRCCSGPRDDGFAELGQPGWWSLTDIERWRYKP